MVVALEVTESTFWDQIRCKWFKKWTKEVLTEQDNQEQQPKEVIFSEVNKEEADPRLPLDQSWTSWINKSLLIQTCMITVCQTDILSDIAVGLATYHQSMVNKSKTFMFQIHQTWWRWSSLPQAMVTEAAQITTRRITMWTCKIFKNIFENDNKLYANQRNL